MSATATSACSTSEAPFLHFNEINRCGIITLNRPKGLNSLTIDMVRSIRSAIHHWSTSKRQLIIVKSSADRAFSVGGDLFAIYADQSTQYINNFEREIASLAHLISELQTTTPIVCLLNGAILGSSVSLVAPGSYNVATTNCIRCTRSRDGYDGVRRQFLCVFANAWSAGHLSGINGNAP